MQKLQILYSKLGYQFREVALLEAALSHRSVRGINNERLEFLGDSIINFIIAAVLYQRCPTANEGELSRLRASLVRGETLADLAQELELGQYLRLGAGELKTGGFRRRSILADAMEAVIGAIYLDAGFEVCQERILTWFNERLINVLQGSSHKDSKTRLQEYLQSQRKPLPVYTITQITGEAHQQLFHVKCQIETLNLSSEGSGTSRRAAEQHAAQRLLEQLGI